VACAAALALLDVLLSEGFLESTVALGEFFRTGLEGIVERRRVASSVRGRGLLLALELTVEAKPVVESVLTRGYLINAVQEKVLRFAPPFIIKEEQLSGFLSVLDDILAELD
jgi:acetylornithine/succinyldiaminopimelate/putrescine aminotransferase